MKPLTMIFALALSGATGCGKDIDRNLVIGEYRANHHKGLDSLELRADGTYVYRYEGQDGRRILTTNQWKFIDDDGKPLILCYEFVFGLPELNNVTDKPRTWAVKPWRPLFGGLLRLNLDPDRGYYYVKQTRAAASVPEG